MILPQLRELPVSIIGTGIAGLATSAALRNIAGIENQVLYEKFSFDQVSSKQAGIGAALQLGPNGLKALKAIGGDEMLDKVYAEGTTLKQHAMFIPGQDAPMIMPDTTFDDTGYSQVLLPWVSFRSILWDSLPDSSKEQGTIFTGLNDDIVGYQMNEENGAIQVTSCQPDQEFPESSLLVAADGINSTFASLINNHDESSSEDTACILEKGKEEKLRKVGIQDGKRINVKAVVPVDMPEAYNLQPHTTYSYFSQSPAVGCFAGPAGEGKTYWAMSIPDREDGSTFLSDVGSEWEGAEVKKRLLQELEQLEMPRETQLARDLIRQTDPALFFTARSEERDIGETLSAPDGLPLVLTGDAAHAMSPGYGQAANFALEDAVTLAVCLQREEKDLASALQAYSHERLTRCKEMQQKSAERAIKAAKGEPTENVNAWIFSWEPPIAVTQKEGIFL